MGLTMARMRAYTCFAMAAAIFAADQISKSWVLHGLKIGEYGRLKVFSFLDLVLVWNQGISYGLFQQDSQAGRWLLIGVSCLIVAYLGIWAWRTRSRLTAWSLGIIIGGALGNVVDRVAYGAVADFVSLHVFGFYWYVFNLADAAIVAGAAGLLYDLMFTSHKSAAKDG